MTMDPSKTEAIDPICGMTVDEATAIHAERDGKTFYFCSDHCRQKFLSAPAEGNPTKRKIFIAGASGAIGRQLCRLLVDEGWSVVGTTHSQDKVSMLRDLGVEPVVVDVFDAPRLLDLVSQATPAIVVDQLTDLPRALDPTKMAEALVRTARLREIGTRNLVAAAVAAGVTRIVAQSLAFVYAPGPMPYTEESPLMVDDPNYGVTARAVVSLEQQVLAAPLTGIVLRYGRLYGPGTGFDSAPASSPLHVDDAADAARRALTRGAAGIYNIAEDDGTVSIKKAATALGWVPGFRLDSTRTDRDEDANQRPRGETMKSVS